jgi:Spy/CpxP family protein refolding chaperone
MKKRTETLLAAFEKDGFDAKKADAFDVKKSRVALEEETKLLQQILPILKPEQREKLAAKMEKGPSPHAGGPKRSGFGHKPLTEPEEDDFGP